MNTSLGNGFSNLMFLLFAKYEYDIQMTDPAVEGDDGLVGIRGELPASHFQELGLTVKMEVHESLSTASFCGLVFDPEEQIIVTEPLKVIYNTPWISRQYSFASKKKLLGLLKSKALSICWQYYGCPIVYNYGLRLLQLLSDHKFETPSYQFWESSIFENAKSYYEEFGFPLVSPGARTRELMESKFGISVMKQYQIEGEISKMTLGDNAMPSLESVTPKLWMDNHDRYVRQFTQESEQMLRSFDVFSTRPYNIKLNVKAGRAHAGSDRVC